MCRYFHLRLFISCSFSSIVFAAATVSMKLPVLGLLVYAATAVQALHPITIKGHKLFDSVTKNQFFIKG